MIYIYYIICILGTLGISILIYDDFLRGGKHVRDVSLKFGFLLVAHIILFPKYWLLFTLAYLMVVLVIFFASMRKTPE